MSAAGCHCFDFNFGMFSQLTEEAFRVLFTEAKLVNFDILYHISGTRFLLLFYMLQIQNQIALKLR